MEQKDKELLIKDLCARVPYRVNVCLDEKETCILTGIDGNEVYLDVDTDSFCIESINPYLRSLSSMTEEEKVEYEELEKQCESLPTFAYISVSKCILFDWLNKHHFDYRNLIMGGLAIEAPEGMYK